LLRGGETGTQVWVQDQAQFYQLDAANAFTLASPLIIAAAGGGRWFRKSKAYVVGNFTLWCQSYGVGFAGYTPGQLLVSGATEPDIILTKAGLTGLGGQQGVVVDNLGNLWLSANDGTFAAITIYKFELKDCLATGPIVPTVTLNVPISTVPTAVGSESGSSIFDSKGGLWSINGTHGTFGVSSFVRYSPKDYSVTGGKPSRTLTSYTPGSVPPNTSNQQDGVFDGEGNLWTSVAFTGDAGGPNGGLVMFSAAQLEAGGLAVVPVIFWRGSNFSGTGLGGVVGLSVGANGFIWTTAIDNKLRAWDPSTAVGLNPAPAITLTCATFSFPYALTFDRAGNLWVQNGNDNRLQRIPAASLAASGAVAADVIINPAVATLTSNITFPNNPDRSGSLSSGVPISL
jgi:hypothetical protein